MALGENEKIKILGVLKNNEDFYYEDFDFYPRKYTDDELIEFVLCVINKYLSGKEIVKPNTLKRHFNALYIIFEFCIITTKNISDEIFIKTIELRQDYQKYLEKLNLQKDEEVMKALAKLVNLVVNNRANIDEDFLRTGSKPVIVESEELLEIKESDILLDELQNKLNDLESKLKLSEKDNSKKDIIIRELKEKKETLEKEIHEYKSKINTITKSNEKLQKEREKIQQKLKKVEEQAAALIKEINDLENSNKELSGKLKLALNDNEKLTKALEQNKKYLEICTKKEQRLLELQTIEKEIILLFSERQISIQEIKLELSKKGFFIIDEELNLILRNIRNTINIIPTTKTIPKTFLIERVPTNNTYVENDSYRLITNEEQEIKILLVADTHSDMKFKLSFDVYKSLYDYCLKNSISNIFLLGDIFDCSHNYDLSKKGGIYDVIEYCKENIAMFLEKYPKCDDINNSYLGGNHEKIMFDVGLNPVSIISNSRLDFVSLGYNDAIIKVEKDQFAVHHPNKVINIPKEEAVKSYLKKYYKNSNLEKSYIDIFGHFHTSCLNPINGYLLLSSLTRNGDSVKGACEMRIILNEKGFIKNIIFVPLVFNRKTLVSSCEMEYKKLVLK